MINYELIKGISNVCDVNVMLFFNRNKVVLVINHNIGSIARYNIIKGITHIFSTNDRYTIRMWMDLNGIKIGDKAYIFTNKEIKNDKNSCLIELKDN